MPKEQIYGDPLHLPRSEESPARSVVEVRWDRETGYFQLATKCIERSTGEDYLPPLEGIEIPMVEQAGGEGFTTTSSPVLLSAEPYMRAEQGWYVDLDRRGINDLIRVLRRARDAAFGKDE